MKFPVEGRKRPRLASWLSEHTVELYMVPRFSAVLAQEFEHTVAFYFWASREGRSVGPAHSLRVIAVYPRRPKFCRDGGGPIMMKINKEVSVAAAEFRRRGIALFAGFPRVRSVFDFAQDAEILWFALRGSGEEEDVVTEVGSGMPSWVEGPLTNAKVCQRVSQDSRDLRWQEAVEAIRDVRQSTGEHQRGPFGAVYKPVYFLAWR